MGIDSEIKRFLAVSAEARFIRRKFHIRAVFFNLSTLNLRF